MKRVLKYAVLLALAAAAAALWWQSLSESQKRYLAHLGRQVPDLPFRYFA